MNCVTPISYSGVRIRLYRRLYADGTPVPPNTTIDLKTALISGNVGIGDSLPNSSKLLGAVAFPNTGGPHLHYEVRHSFVPGNGTNPPSWDTFDPFYWTNGRLGVHRQNRMNPMDWTIKETLRSEEGSDAYAP